MKRYPKLILPPPDGMGNYWFGLKAHPPCILTIKNPKHPVNKPNHTRNQGLSEIPLRYMAIPDDGDESVPLDEEGNVKAFDTPNDALKEINETIARSNRR